MPHIDIKCYPGRTEEQKNKLAERIAEDVAEIFGTKLSSVSVAIEDVQQEDWKEQVWDREIAPKRGRLYKEPGYDYE
ncbi:MAG: tautomerase PptA [Acetatifactor sp.]